MKTSIQQFLHLGNKPKIVSSLGIKGFNRWWQWASSKNVPLPNQQSNGADLNEGQVWGCDCIHEYAVTRAANTHPKISRWVATKEQISSLDLLKHLPWKFIVNVIISKTLTALTNEKCWWKVILVDMWSVATHGHCVWSLDFPETATGQTRSLTRGKIQDPIIFLCGCSSVSLIVLLKNYPSQTGCLHLFVIGFGRCTRWLRWGINIWLMYLSLVTQRNFQTHNFKTW